jgi:hypothetical protein
VGTIDDIPATAELVARLKAEYAAACEALQAASRCYAIAEK